jgi:porin
LASTPYAAPGARLRFDPIPQFYAQVGGYDGYPDLKDGGVRINLNDDEGALLYFEVGYRLNHTKEASGPPGNLKLGGYYHTDDFADNYDIITAFAGFPGAGAKPPHSGNYGIYFLADQVLWREVGKDDPARQGLVGFLQVAGAPPDRNLAQFGVNGGLVYKGLIPQRDWDTLGLAGSYLQMSDDIRRAQEDINAVAGPGTVPVADHESVIEINYKAQLTAWWSILTSAQHVWHPGGRLASETPDAWVLIVQSVFRF